MSNPDKLQTIYVSQLPWSVRDRHLKEFFESKGEVTDCFVAYQGRKSRGFGYVTFSTADAATAALKMDGQQMTSSKEGEEGRAIAVVIAKPREPEAEAAAKARVAERAAGGGKGRGKGGGKGGSGDAKPKPKAKEGEAKKAKEGGKGGRGKKEKAAGEAAPAAEAAPKKEKNPDQLQFNIAVDQFDFLKACATKYEFKGLNIAAKKLLAFAKDDEDNEVFAGAPERPETLKKLRLNLNEEERALIAKAQETHKYANRHVPFQALLKYVMPPADSKDPVEKAAAEKMLDDIFKKE